MILSLYVGTVIPVACLPSSGPPAAPESSDASIQLRNDVAGEIPCAPRRVLREVCQRCHVSPPRNGAPFPLLTRANVLSTYGGSVVRELMIEQLEARRMPLAPVTIEDDDRATLLAWLHAGAPAGGACAAADDASTDARVAANDASTDARDAERADDAGVDADIDAELDAGADE